MFIDPGMVEQCAPGKYDNDNKASTPCADCPTGTYSGTLSLTCETCARGKHDGDVDPATPCELCGPGNYTEPGETTCTPCPGGRVDHVRLHPQKHVLG